MSPLFVAFIAMLHHPIFTSADISHIYLPAPPSSKGTGPVWSGPLAMPKLLSDGTIAETVEVAAARSAHLAALETARALDPDMGKDNGQYDPQKYGDHAHRGMGPNEDLLKTILSYKASKPAPVYGAPLTDMNNTMKSKGDVSSEGDVHRAPKIGSKGGNAVALRTVHGAPSVDVVSSYRSPVEQNISYLGPLAMLQLLASGYLEDTPEVVAARNIHLKALKEAQAAGDLWRLKMGAAGRTWAQS